MAKIDKFIKADPTGMRAYIYKMLCSAGDGQG